MMKLRSWSTLAVLAIMLICFLPRLAVAYVGPGTGLSAIGVFLAAIAGIIVAIFGFFWYPIKRLLRKKKQRNDGKGGDGK